MSLAMLAAVFIGTGGGTQGVPQQALLLDPGGAVSFKNSAVSYASVAVSKDEKTFSYEGHTYLFSGKSFWDMVAFNAKKYDVLDHLKVEGGKLLFDGASIDVGHEVLQVYQAVRWGDLVACLSLIPHFPRSWWESSKAHALIVFSPSERRGGFLGLTQSGKVNYKLTLVDPIANTQK